MSHLEAGWLWLAVGYAHNELVALRWNRPIGGFFSETFRLPWRWIGLACAMIHFGIDICGRIR